MDRTVTKTEWVLIACNVVMLGITLFACGMAKAQHDALVREQSHQFVIGVPAWTRTNNLPVYYYETNR